MKLQAALDRITLDQAMDLARAISSHVDIIEVGTSLIKDYGMDSVRQMKREFPGSAVLADLKTMDEGAYEFRAAYRAGADIATVMAAASVDTIAACYEVAEEAGKSIMIDLLGAADEKIDLLQRFDEAIFCVHAPVDEKSNDLLTHLQQFEARFSGLKNLSVAGGIQLEDIFALNKKAVRLESVIVGSAISKAEDPRLAAEQFSQAVKGDSEQ
jgi:3-hexulose-6-phosphate synthase